MYIVKIITVIHMACIGETFDQLHMLYVTPVQLKHVKWEKQI
jgi:hypothetical protein